jgi:hypothetical protein
LIIGEGSKPVLLGARLRAAQYFTTLEGRNMSATIPAAETNKAATAAKTESKLTPVSSKIDELFSGSRAPLEQAEYAVAFEEREVFDSLEKVLSLR